MTVEELIAQPNSQYASSAVFKVTEDSVPSGA
jgi:hypothetical protein